MSVPPVPDQVPVQDPNLDPPQSDPEPLLPPDRDPPSGEPARRDPPVSPPEPGEPPAVIRDPPLPELPSEERLSSAAGTNVSL